jgi:hypothetical protein
MSKSSLQYLQSLEILKVEIIGNDIIEFFNIIKSLTNLKKLTIKKIIKDLLSNDEMTTIAKFLKIIFN